MTDHSMMRLGRKAVKTDTRTLALASYLNSTLPSPPPIADWTKGISNWGMMLNGPDPATPQYPNGLGDCTIAGVAHAVPVFSANTGAEVTVSDSAVLRCYEKWDGYVQGDPSTDSGGVELDVLKDWRKHGFAGNKLVGFADPDPANLDEVRQSIALFGGVYIGLALPVTAQMQDVWDVAANSGASAKPGSWGGHCVFVPKYDADTFTCITWGQLKTMTVAFWQVYCDEAHTLLAQNWFTRSGVDPAGLNLSQLQADLNAIN